MPSTDDLAGTGAPAWLAPLLVELRGVREAVVELTQIVKGGGDAPGHAEQLRTIGSRVAFLEQLVKWAAGIGTAILTALGVAWATFTGHAPPHP